MRAKCNIGRQRRAFDKAQAQYHSTVRQHGCLRDRHFASLQGPGSRSVCLPSDSGTPAQRVEPHVGLQSRPLHAARRPGLQRWWVVVVVVVGGRWRVRGRGAAAMEALSKSVVHEICTNQARLDSTPNILLATATGGRASSGTLSRLCAARPCFFCRVVRWHKLEGQMAQTGGSL